MTMMLNYFENVMKQFEFKKFVLIGSLAPLFITGCTGLSGTQPPAPVYSNNKPFNAPVPPTVKKPVAPKIEKEEVVQVQPLQDFTPIEKEEIKAEPITVTPVEPPVNADIPKVIEVKPPSKPLLMPTPPADTGVPKFEPAPSIPEFKPAESSTAQSPAVNALVSAANKSSNTGDLESAAAAIERAIRIEPRNGELLYKLAVLRLKQSKPVLAEDLAKKAELLAGKDSVLKKNSWLLIAHAKEMQGDKSGADVARQKAAGF
jgi:tetratricopeptide (TPR) repeat protein